MPDILRNIATVQENIKNAALRTGRNPDDIILVAVSKKVNIQKIMEAYRAGLKHFGENRAQEFRKKYQSISAPINWHFIGHLQSNKVKYIIGKVFLIHSLDRFSLAEELDKRAAKLGIKADVLVQVNVSGEESKHGIELEKTGEFIETVAKKYKNISIKGLMTMAPFTENPEDVRPFFAGLRECKDRLQKEKIPGVEMQYLSMGMTNDYLVAVEEGANIVRIGTAIFGPRQE